MRFARTHDYRHTSAMGHSQASKAATRERLVVTAARRLLREGTQGACVADIAADAEITAGAIYRHFASRDVLLQEAFATAATVLEDWKARAPDFDTAIAMYLSPSHRDAIDSGCPVAALASDMAHTHAATEDALRAAYTRQVREVFDMLADRLQAQGDASREAIQEARSRAIVSWCASVGALALSRAVTDRALADGILADVATQITRWQVLPPAQTRR